MKAIFSVLIISSLVFGLIFAFRQMSQERAREQEREKPVAAPSRLSHNPRGQIILTFDSETQKRTGLVVAQLTTEEHRATRQGFARVLDPASLTPLLSELALARTNLAASEKELTRAQVLAAHMSLSEKALLAAENTTRRDRLVAQVAEEKLALAFGREIANRADLPQLSRSLSSLEAALVRVDLSPGQALMTAPVKARLFAPANEADQFEAEFVGPAMSVEPEFQGQAFFYLVSQTNRRLASGANLTALLELSESALAGVVVPRAAVVRSEGRAWAFVQTGNDTFDRREVTLTRPARDGWFVTEGFKPGEKVVVTGAQVLQSEAGKSAIRMLE